MRTILMVLATILATGGCGGSPVAPDAPDRTDCGLFSDRATSPFVLPFESGRAFLAGRTIEHGDPQRYAIDWIMPTNTSVIAARAGRVVAAERQWNDTDHAGACVRDPEPGDLSCRVRGVEAIMRHG